MTVAIVDYGLGNLYSIKQACEHFSYQALITSSPQDIWKSDAVILPGVGAFGSAMASLRRLDLVAPLREVAASGKPLIGICLGLQLLMRESWEFGRHQGLGIIDGEVVPFRSSEDGREKLKVPHIGWSGIFRDIKPDIQQSSSCFQKDSWAGSPLEGLADGEGMYFIHSFYAKPVDPGVVLSVSRHGHVAFCSSLRRDNVFATQFHPERSGSCGLRIYSQIGFLGQAEQRKEKNNV